MDVNLNLPPRLISKIKAYNSLSDNSGNLDDAIVGLLDRVVTQELMALLGNDLGLGHTVPTIGYMQAIPAGQNLEDLTGISAGLGDAVPRPSKKKAKPPARGVQSEENLDEDMILDDPDHEANADAADVSLAQDGEAEDTFAAMMNLPPPPKDKKAKRVKGVTPMTGEERSTF